jgi:hypothetical protein
MLTTNQKRKLIKKDDLDQVTRAKYEYIAVKKLQSTLTGLADADFILRMVPSRKVQKYLTDEHIETLLKTSIRLMKLLEYRKIRSIDNENLIVFQEDAQKHIQIVPPSQNDLERAKLLYDHLYKLGAFVDADLLKSVQIPGYEKPNRFPGGYDDAFERFERLLKEKEKRAVSEGGKGKDLS